MCPSLGLSRKTCCWLAAVSITTGAFGIMLPKFPFLIIYLGIGTINTLVGNAIFWIMWEQIGDAAGFMTTTVISTLLSMSFSFLSHNIFVFKTPDNTSGRFIRFLATQAFALSILSCTTLILVALFRVDHHLSYFLGSTATIVISMKINQAYVFAKTSPRTMRASQ